MNYNIKTSSYFDVAAKKLAKKYPSFKEDIKAFREELLKNPLQGVELSPGIRKIRMAIKSKGKGKSGGARIMSVMLSVLPNINIPATVKPSVDVERSLR